MQVACVGEKRNTCRILVGKPEGKRRIRRPKPTGLRAGQTVVRIPGQTNVHLFSKTSIPALACYKEVWRDRLNTKMDVGGSKKVREFLDELRNYISRTALLNGLPYPSFLLLLLLH